MKVHVTQTKLRSRLTIEYTYSLFSSVPCFDIVDGLVNDQLDIKPLDIYVYFLSFFSLCCVQTHVYNIKIQTKCMKIYMYSKCLFSIRHMF